MAELSKKTARILIDDVASLIDIQLTDNTTPSRAQVVEWLNQGTLEVLRLVPSKELSDATIYIEKWASTFTDSDLTHKMLRIISMKRNGVSCEYVEENEFSRIRQFYPHKYTLMNPAYTKTKTANNIRFMTWPSGKVLWQLTYVPYPFVYATGILDEEEETPDSRAIPSSLESFVITYAAAYARVQDEEPGQFQLYIADWRQRLQMIYGIQADTIEGSL